MTRAESASIGVMDGLSGYNGGRKRYVEIHFAVDVKIKEILAMEVTTDGIHDSKALPSLITNASRHRLISEAFMDGAYDSIKSYRLLRRMLE